MKQLRTILSVALTTLALCSLTGVANARITDAAGDFISTYTGPQGADLDVLSSDVFYDGTNYTLTTTLNGLVGTTANAIYVFGFDRGGATGNPAPFASIGIDNVFFNSVVILRPDSTVTVNRIGVSATNFAAGTATISGSTISATISGTELPSTGFAGENYTWNLWPRINGGTTANIADFAPNNSNVAVTVVPEAGTATLLLPVLGMVGVALARRKRA